MKVNRFDVVELNDGNKATILNFQNNGYLVEVVGHDGKSLGSKEITDNDINKVIFCKLLKWKNKFNRYFSNQEKYLAFIFIIRLYPIQQ